MWGLKLRALECYGKSRPYVKSHILQVAKASDSTSVFPVNIGADWASLVAQRLKLLPAMWETQVRSLDREELLEKEMATRSSILAWRIPWTEEPGGLQSMGSQRVGPDRVTNTFTFTYTAKECGFKHFILSREPDDSKPVTPSLGNSIP